MLRSPEEADEPGSPVTTNRTGAPARLNQRATLRAKSSSAGDSRSIVTSSLSTAVGPATHPARPGRCRKIVSMGIIQDTAGCSRTYSMTTMPMTAFVC
jgi:hypothetical protein